MVAEDPECFKHFKLPPVLNTFSVLQCLTCTLSQASEEPQEIKILIKLTFIERLVTCPRSQPGGLAHIWPLTPVQKRHSVRVDKL